MKITKETLQRLYVDEVKTSAQIGELLGVSRSTIINRLKEFGIPIRKVGSRSSHIQISKEELERLYITENKTSTEIGKIYNLHKTTILDHLKKHGIKAKPNGGYQKRREIDIKKVEELYVDRNLTTPEIAEMYGVDHKTIWNRLNEFGVKRRSFGTRPLFTSESYKRHVHDETFGEYAALGDFVNTTTVLLMKHDLCKYEWVSKPRYFLEGARCPLCSESKGEKRISTFLLEKNYEFQKEFSFADCRSSRPLRFDFAILKDGSVTCLIEYQGEQHFRKVDYFGGSERFKIQKQNDATKRAYCKKNNIPLIEIPYTEKNIEEFLEMALSQKIGKQLSLSIL